MYKTQQRIDEGRETMRHNPARDITAAEIHEIKEAAGPDVYKFGEDMFLLGVAIGARIARQEAPESIKEDMHKS